MTTVTDRSGFKKLFLSFDGNAPCVRDIPQAITVTQGEKVVIPAVVPYRPAHMFICWNMPASGSGKAYFPCDTIQIPDKSIELYAQWQSLCCGINEKDKKTGI